MRISDWSSDVCSSDLGGEAGAQHRQPDPRCRGAGGEGCDRAALVVRPRRLLRNPQGEAARKGADRFRYLDHRTQGFPVVDAAGARALRARRSEEHTSELQSLMRISYAVFFLKKKKNKHTKKYKRLNTKETVPNLSQLTLP